MYSTSSNRTQPAATVERRSNDKQPNFIQRFYLFGTNPNTSSSSSSANSCSTRESSTSPSPPPPSLQKTPKKNPSADSEVDLPYLAQSHHYSVQRLKQFWNNRLSLSSPSSTGTSEVTISRKLKTVSLGSSNPLRKPTTPEFLRRNSSTRGSASRRNVVRSSLVPLYSKTASPKAARSRIPDNEISTTANQKRSSVVLSPVKDLKKEKRSCLERVGCNAGFPLVTATASGGRINWARRVELLGIRSQKEDTKMPIKVENYVNNFMEVDIQNEPTALPNSVTPPPEPATEEQLQDPVVIPNEKLDTHQSKQGMRDSLDSKKSLSSTDSQSVVRRHGTPTRKVSFRTMTAPSKSPESC